MGRSPAHLPGVADLAALPPAMLPPECPRQGLLSFFADLELAIGSVDEQDAGDDYRVLYHAGQRSALRPHHCEGNPAFHREPHRLSLSEEWTLPEPESGTDRTLKDLWLLTCRQPCHRMFGHASTVQEGTLEASEPVTSPWVLLLQLDAELWPVRRGTGRFYFTIRRDDLARGAFDRCVLVGDGL